MPNDMTFDYNGVIVETAKTMKLLKKIIILEATNLKSKEKNDSAMIKQIRDLLEEEVNVTKIA
ncbi:MAG: hypothetical protein LBG80_19500 [Bacteroidales bacterium]|jgi:hypothetical protein|nr:hypothetical protein [Bacteroidales bacterium]